jgi:hypothetical protein
LIFAARILAGMRWAGLPDRRGEGSCSTAPARRSRNFSAAAFMAAALLLSIAGVRRARLV